VVFSYSAVKLRKSTLKPEMPSTVKIAFYAKTQGGGSTQRGGSHCNPAGPRMLSGRARPHLPGILRHSKFSPQYRLLVF